MIEEVTVNCLFLQAEITYDGAQSIRFHLNIGYASLFQAPYRALSHMCSRSLVLESHNGTGGQHECPLSQIRQLRLREAKNPRGKVVH